MVKVSVNRFVYQRVNNVRCELEAYTRRLRKKALKNLEEIFETAKRIAQGEIKHQRINGKMFQITLSQRRTWLKIAEQAVETMNILATDIDEKEIKNRLNTIETLVTEAIRQSQKNQQPRSS